MKHLSSTNQNQQLLTNVPDGQNPTDAVNMSQLEVKADKYMFNVRDYGAVGNGSADDTAAFQAAYDAAEPTLGTVYIPIGEYLISAPVNMKGCSTVGESQTQSIVLADPTTPIANWKLTTHDNDVGMLYAINKSDWTAENFKMDMQDTYTTGITAFGGNNIHYRKLWSIDSANCAMQFMGNRLVDHELITNSSITNCIGENSRWNFIFDGGGSNVTISNNISKNGVNRHISVDPQEAFSTKEQRGIIINANICDGRRPIPSDWLTDPSNNSPDFAIGTKATFFGVVTNNYVRNWTDVVTGSYNSANDTSPSYSEVITKVAGLGIRGAGGVWSNNTIHLDGDITEPMDAGISIINAQTSLRVSGNAVYGPKRAIVLDGSSDFEISSNMFNPYAHRYPDTEVIGTGRDIYLSGSRGSNVRIIMNVNKQNERIVDESSEWVLLKRVKLTSASKTIDVTDIPPADKLMIRYDIATTGGTCELRLRFNNDSGLNYGRAYSSDGGADQASSDQAQISGPGNTNEPALGIIEVINHANRDKLAWGKFVRASSGATIPSRREGAYKWNNTSEKINRVSLVTTSTGSYDVGSEVEVFGRS